MPIARSKPIRFTPRGCSDAVDGTNAFPGAMAQLANLVPDPATSGVVVPRPAISLLFDFASNGFSSPGFISSLLIVGNTAYGTIASTRNAGKDEPFCVNLATGQPITVSGIVNANTPTSPATSGAWFPPIVCQVGSRVIVCHPGFTGAGGFKFGWFDLSGFTTSGLTCSTHGNTTIDTLNTSGGAVPTGIQPGMLITCTDFPAGTYVVSTTATTITASEPATGSHTTLAITVAGGTTSAPLWGAGDTDRNGLTTVPLGVAQMNGRAYYAVAANGTQYSDAGFPGRMSNTSGVQALTTNDGLSVTAIAPLMLSAPLTGGIVQGLVAFEGVNRMQQITGDQSFTGGLTMNLLPVATGTAAPLSIAPCEMGTAFISPEGLRVIKFDGTVSEPIGDGGMGVTVPFINAAVPSRMCAAANSHVIRCAAQNGSLTGSPEQEWWLDLGERGPQSAVGRKMWTGPMSTVPSLIQAWQGTTAYGTFVIAPIGINAQLYVSDPVPYATSTYIEGGQQMQWTYQPCPLPDTDQMAMNELVEMAIAGAFDSEAVVATALDISGQYIDTTQIPIVIANPPIWGQVTWGKFTWGIVAGIFQQWPVYWHKPLVFKQLNISFVGDCASAVRIGNLYIRYQITGYVLPVPAGIAA